MKRNTNSESTYPHLFAAVLGSVAVIVAGCIISWFLVWRDPVNKFIGTKVDHINGEGPIEVSIPDSIIVLKGDTVLVDQSGNYLDGFSANDRPIKELQANNHLVKLEELQ